MFFIIDLFLYQLYPFIILFFHKHLLLSSNSNPLHPCFLASKSVHSGKNPLHLLPVENSSTEPSFDIVSYPYLVLIKQVSLPYSHNLWLSHSISLFFVHVQFLFGLKQVLLFVPPFLLSLKVSLDVDTVRHIDLSFKVLIPFGSYSGNLHIKKTTRHRSEVLRPSFPNIETPLLSLFFQWNSLSKVEKSKRLLCVHSPSHKGTTTTQISP